MNSVVVVESPAKAKTIEGYLGDSYSVIASFGHVRDMEDKDGAVIPGSWSDIKWSLNNKGKEQVKEILSLLKKAEHLILATDPDREGEAIAWHIYELLNEKGAIQDIKVSRAVFNSITKSSVLEAIDNLRAINQDKVEAYLARRVLDYIVGFNISPLLWRRLPGAKSAGRVQSVALKLICERENEREAFEPQEYWTIQADFLKNQEKVPSQIQFVDGKKLKKFDISNENNANELADRARDSVFSISEINKKPLKTFAPYNLLKTMRAGVLVLGPLLAKYKVAKVSLPGGCAIGSRPINLHLEALKKLGMKYEIKKGNIHAKSNAKLKGNNIK